ncbi:GNAT family N-acetyltransferase [uncultured Psychroserpens sp.]|uniref:GNAT family N-acetyltransferase n=1 Tax=uncultured Psychroserpens sp. TaxID=255436 RepID=UPI0026269B79|nr:GNAT family N-acetyltransferase [uncultured Psychroserpens sp.]
MTITDITIKRYDSTYKSDWDEFLNLSENATFLFKRNFMDYHQDRFDDFSLMIYDTDDLVAVFPANHKDHLLYSHQGLTYGGLVYLSDLDINSVKKINKALVDYLSKEGITLMTIKTMPKIYQSEVLNQVEGFENVELIASHMVLAIDYNSDFKIHKTKIKRYKKLNSNGLTIREGEAEFDVFWNTILVPRLKEKHNSKPVHSLSEIKYLREQFKKEILQYNVYRDDEVLAGITIFNKGNVVKSQYGIATAEGERLNALDMLFVYLIYKYRDEGKQYFSMGTVSNDSQLGYSSGMLKQKQEFGCDTCFQEIMKVTIND